MHNIKGKEIIYSIPPTRRLPRLSQPQADDGRQARPPSSRGRCLASLPGGAGGGG